MARTIRIGLMLILAAGLLVGCNRNKTHRDVDAGMSDRPRTLDPEPIDISVGGTAPGADPYGDIYSGRAGNATAPTITLSDPIPPQTQTPMSAQRTYTVRKGDTLWSIAKRELGSGTRWQEITAINPGLDAKRLPIGATLRLPN